MIRYYWIVLDSICTSSAFEKVSAPSSESNEPMALKLGMVGCVAASWQGASCNQTYGLVKLPMNLHHMGFS